MGVDNPEITDGAGSDTCDFPITIDLSDAELTESPSGEPDNLEFRKFWNEFIRDSINTARTHCYLKKAEIEDPNKLSTLSPVPVDRSVVQKGAIVTMRLNGYFEQIGRSFKQGDSVKIASMDPGKDSLEYDDMEDWHRYIQESNRVNLMLGRMPKFVEIPNKRRSGKEVSTVRAVVKSIQKDAHSGNIVAVFELEERGKVRGDWKVEVRRNEKTDGIDQELNLIEYFDSVGSENDSDGSSKGSCAEVFKNGEFLVGKACPREQRPNLDKRQNQIYGLAMEETPEGGELANKVLFLHGPPGSGKTTTLCEMTREHAKRGRKVLVISHSNKGVTVPASMIASKGKGEKNLLHIAGNIPENFPPSLQKFRMKRKLKHPAPKLKEINGMSDEKFFEYMFPDEMPEIREKTIQALRDSRSYLWGVPDEEILNDEKFPEKLRIEIQEAIRDRGKHSGNGYIPEMKKLAREALLNQYKAQLARKKAEFERSIEKGGMVFSTLGTLMNDEILADVEFDVVIVDEATRLQTPHLALALKKAGKQIIFVEDPFQLGNIPLDPKSRKALEDVMDREARTPEKQNTSWGIQDNVRRKIFDIYKNQGDAAQACDIFEEGPAAAPLLRVEDREKHLPYVFLNKNRRSLPNIVRLLSELIYDGKLEPGREGKEGEGQGVIQFIDTKRIVASEKASGTSKKNPAEAEIIARKVMQRIKAGAKPEEIAVIATYRKQAEAIKKTLDRMLNHGIDKTTGKPSEKDLANRALYAAMAGNIDSVDAFQGAEKKIVFVSLTRSNAEGHIGFLDEERRIGVAIGRAQDELYIVGDSDTVVTRNENPASRAFFEKMYELIGECGKIEERRKKGESRA